MTRRSSVRKLRTDSSSNKPFFVASAISPPGLIVRKQFRARGYYLSGGLQKSGTLEFHVAAQHQLPRSALICASSSRVENGLVTYRSAPTARPLVTSASRPFAESIT